MLYSLRLHASPIHLQPAGPADCPCFMAQQHSTPGLRWARRHAGPGPPACETRCMQKSRMVGAEAEEPCYPIQTGVGRHGAARGCIGAVHLHHLGVMCITVLQMHIGIHVLTALIPYYMYVRTRTLLIRRCLSLLGCINHHVPSRFVHHCRCMQLSRHANGLQDKPAYRLVTG